MIDVHDMMVGNWYHDDKYDAITTLTPNLSYQTILNTCSGIPVTVDILKRIGFEDDTTAGEPWVFWRYWDKNGRFKLDVHVGEIFCNSDRKFGLHVDNDVCNTIGSGEFSYVHELQNLVRCITRRSLPIEKEMIYGNTDKDTLA
jgi:hypothetical protein